MDSNKKILNDIITLKTGFYSALALLIFSIIVFGFGIIAIPPSGPNCPGNCMSYPYLNIMDYFPRDYIWICIAIFQLCVFLIFIIANHFNAPSERKIFSFISIAFALVSMTILTTDYFIQFAVIPISLMKGQTEGIALLTQYNGHGIFIVMEELGYFMMSVAFLFLAPVFDVKTRLEKALRWIFITPFIVTVLSFAAYSIIFGLDRDYRHEVVAFSINFLAMILSGILLTIYYKKEIKTIRA